MRIGDLDEERYSSDISEMRCYVRVRKHFCNAFYGSGNQVGNLFGLPSVLYRKTKDCRYRRSRWEIQQEIRFEIVNETYFLRIIARCKSGLFFKSFYGNLLFYVFKFEMKFRFEFFKNKNRQSNQTKKITEFLWINSNYEYRKKR